MKSINYSNIICSIIIGISIITCSFIVQGFDGNKELITAEITQSKRLMSVKEAAEYLQIPESKVWVIIKDEDGNLATDSKRFPVVRIENEIYISAIGLDEWLKDLSILGKEY